MDTTHFVFDTNVMIQRVRAFGQAIEKFVLNEDLIVAQ